MTDRQAAAASPHGCKPPHDPGLAVAAVLQVPALLDWLNEDRTILRELVGPGSDPFGFNLIPAVMIFWLPALEAATLVAFVATSIAAVSAPRRVAAAVLLSGIILQTGLVAVEYVALETTQDIGRAVAQILGNSPDTVAAQAQAADWFARYGGPARNMTARIAAIFAGYIVTLVMSTYAARSGASQNTAPEAAGANSPPADPVVRPSISPASVLFDQPQYVLRVRHAFAAVFIPGSASYDIDTIPPSARTRFSFSWATGILRREPAGPDVLHIKAAERHGLVKRAYVVTEASSGTLLGKLVPSGSDWEILDPFGRVVSTVLQTAAAFDREQYVMKAGHEDVCRFTWISTFTTVTAEFEVEYLAAAAERIDRALPMALAPILEGAARRRSQRS